MPFRMPTFNLLYNAWRRIDFTAGHSPAGPPVIWQQPCNLMYGDKDGLSAARIGMWLLTPPGTDLRDPWGYTGLTLGQADAVEVPAGSGRFYSVLYFDDVALGFPTHHNAALICKGGYFGNGAGYLDPQPWPQTVPPPAPPTPGLTCGTAGPFPFGTAIASGNAPPNVDWWYFPITAGKNYTLNVTAASANFGTAQMWSGLCAGLTARVLLLGVGSGTWGPAPANDSGYIAVGNNLLGAMTYTFNVVEF